MTVTNLTLIGGGVLGSQIAYQSAFRGCHVTVWLRSEASIGRAKPKFERLHNLYLEDLEACKAEVGKPAPRFPRAFFDDPAGVTEADIEAAKKQADAAYEGLVYELDLAKAVQDADLIIEALAEDPKQKTEFYQKLAPVLPEKTILCTNSSTLLPSQFAEVTGAPERYMALHFANEIWKNNTAEVMGHAGTRQDVYDAVVAFAKQIGMIPLCLKKEQPGYILNSMLVPFLSAAEMLYATDVADPETIDKTWMLATGAPAGPFRILDVVGLVTAYNIVTMNPQAADPETVPGKIAAKLKSYIDAGKTGINAGEGFYKYK
ncbi:MAG: 3-hydroxyacyl-CoA dehydrogenase [Eubacteriales bacterium]|nr:3-hydroxyacyl-CoA dehydrogenase [Eubacteriales bacterium]